MKYVNVKGMLCIPVTCPSCNSINYIPVESSIIEGVDCESCGRGLAPFKIEDDKTVLLSVITRNGQVKAMLGRNASSMYSEYLGGVGGPGLGALLGAAIGGAFATGCYPGNAQQKEELRGDPMDALYAAVYYFIAGIKLSEPYDGDATEGLTDVFTKYLYDTPLISDKTTSLPDDSETTDLVESITSFTIALCNNNRNIQDLADNDKLNLVNFFQYNMDEKNGNLDKKEIKAGYKRWPLLKKFE